MLKSEHEYILINGIFFISVLNWRRFFDTYAANLSPLFCVHQACRFLISFGIP